MRDEVDIAKNLKIVWSGIFDFSDLYSGMKDWLEFKGYGNEEENFRESKYEERIAGDSKKYEIQWSAEKEFGPYLSNVIEVSFLVVGLTDVEIEREGVKLSANKGEVEIRLTGKIIKDPKDNLNAFLQIIYDKILYKSRIEEHKNEMYNTIYSFQKEIKNFLELKNF